MEQINDSTKELRRQFFQKCIDLFEQSNDVLSNLEMTCASLDIKKEDLKKAENSADLLNTSYWYFIDNVIRPIINKPDDSDPRVDIYKILSCIEYTIAIEGVYIYEADKKKTAIVNASLSFFSAIHFLCNWDGYKSYFKDLSNIKSFFNDHRENRPEAMSIQDEHIAIIALSSSISNVPFFSNAAWWRSICLNIVKL